MRAIGQLPVVAWATLAVCFTAVDAGAVPAREYQLEDGGAIAPHVRIEVGTDSNPLRSTSGSDASAFVRVEPTVNYIVRNRNNRLRLRYIGDYLQYSTSYCNSVPSFNNSVVEAGDCADGEPSFNKASFQDHTFAADTFLEVNRRLRVVGDVRLALQHQPIGTGLTANALRLRDAEEPVSFTDRFAKVSLSYGASRARGEIRASLALVDRDYDEDSDPTTNLSDLNERRVQPEASLFYRVGSRTQAFGGFGLAQVRGGNSERDNTKFFVGLEFDSSGITTGSVRLTSEDQEFEDGREFSFNGFELGITWKPKTYSTVEFSGLRQTERGQFDTSSLGLSTTLSADWTHYWTDLFSTRLYVESLTNDQATISAANQGNGSTGDDRNVSIRLEANYNVRRWFDVGAFFESDSRSGQDNLGFDREFERTLIGISVNGTI